MTGLLGSRLTSHSSLKYRIAFQLASLDRCTFGGKMLLLFAAMCAPFGFCETQTIPTKPVQHARAPKAFVPGALWLDDKGVFINAHGGGVLFHQGTYYWFGEHKIAGEAGNVAHVGVHVYSSKDLYRWKDDGIALAVSRDPESDITEGCILERPKVIYNAKTRKFVMWFHLELKGKGYGPSRVGVAVADRPTGPYTFLYSTRPNYWQWPENAGPDLKRTLNDEERKGMHWPKDQPRPADVWDLYMRRDYEAGQQSRDMNLFVDDDGAAYLVYASEQNGTIQIARLTDDYLHTSGHYIRILIGVMNEAPAMCKRNGKYYLFTSGVTGWAPNAARLAMADSIMGNWKVMGNPVQGTPDEMKTTFDSQSTYVLSVQGKKDAFIFMADRWNPKNAIDGRYIWLPVQWSGDKPLLTWKDTWRLEDFSK